MIFSIYCYDFICKEKAKYFDNYLRMISFKGLKNFFLIFFIGEIEIFSILLFSPNKTLKTDFKIFCDLPDLKHIG